MVPCWRGPPTHDTDLMRLEMEEHSEVICFIVVSVMTESIILDLAWLDKRASKIWYI